MAGAGPAEQDWALASALAHRSSRPARSRAWLGTGLVVGAPSVELVWRVLAAFDALDGLPYRKAVGIALVFVCSAMGLAGAAAFRSSTRAADAAAVDILIAAGRDPVSITRQVFRDTTRFAWWAYVCRPEPTDQSRIAAAERRGRTPAAGSAARIALGGDPPPPWWKRPHATSSSPLERISAAERHRARPAPPLH